MPFDPLTATRSPGTPRPWVFVYLERPGAVLRRDDTLHTDDAPPTYEQVIAQNAGLPTYAQAAGLDTVPRRLPESRAIPRQVANEPASWPSPSDAYASAAPEHPQVQARELHALLERITRNESKLDSAYYRMLEERVERCERQRVRRIFCGGGLFEDSAGDENSAAECSYRHYAKKVRKLQDDYATLTSR